MLARLPNPAGGRCSLELDGGDHISRRIGRSRDWYERDLLDDIYSRRPQGVAVDVGAHAGNHTVWMAAVCGLKVHAFEPNPATRHQLQHNVALNSLTGRVTIHPEALGAHESRARLVELQAGNSGMVSVEPDAAGTVRVQPLDNFGLENVDLIKVDVEGAELDILRGAKETIRRCRPVLYIEAATPERRDAVDAWLRPLGYRRFGQFAITPTYGYAAPSTRQLKLSTTIMAHPRRRGFVGSLIAALDAPASITWDQKNDRWDTGRRALLAVDPDATHHMIIQDDAIVAKDLTAAVLRRVGEKPTSPISLYLGRQRPHAAKFTHIVADARQAGRRWVSYPELCWGVGLVFPRELIEPVVEWGDAHATIANYDMRISRYLERVKIPTWYTLPSLVDHRAGADSPSLIAGRTGGNRVAHWFVGRDIEPQEAYA
jgi:FkbM family methyltransferase